MQYMYNQSNAMTTKDAIKLLPIDDELKLQILRTYDYMDDAQKLAISRIAWKTYDLLRQTEIDLNIEKELDKVEKGEAHLGQDFYGRVLEHAQQNMTIRHDKKSGDVDLAKARAAMYQIIQEMQDAKIAKKEKNKDVKN